MDSEMSQAEMSHALGSFGAGPEVDLDTLEKFELGTLALVCRWRIAAGALPLKNRHLRALKWRALAGKPVEQTLVNWAKQHLEWNLYTGTRSIADGVLMLVIDEDGRAAMSAGPYEPLKDCSREALIGRAEAARAEAQATGVQPEVLWSLQDGWLTAYTADGKPAATTSLVLDLAQTLHIPVGFEAGHAAGQDAPGLVFLSSDEHGIVPAQDAFAGAHAADKNYADAALLDKLCAGYARLLLVEAARAK